MSTSGLVLRGPSGKSVELADRIVAGRLPDCDIVLQEGNPSRRHAQITMENGTAWLEDLGSANGTFVNDRAVTARVQLRPGDRIRFDVEKWELSALEREGPDSKTVVNRTESADHKTVVAAGPSAPKPPGAWADPDRKDGTGTKLIDPKDLQKMLQDAAATPAATVVDAPYLIISSGRLSGQSLKLRPSQTKNVWNIGSDAERDIVIDDDGVSGFHAKIINEGNRWKLIDQMSANGTFVNGAKTTVHFLTSGDRVRFGPVDCVFKLPVGGPRTGANRRLPWVIAGVSFLATGAILAVLWWFF
jgi:pSer/pThr/pTyr-binding forkhead associated (FHA) protein